MIIDEVKIHLKAGCGGDGGNIFLKQSRAKQTGFGGDGGSGADIFIKASLHLYDLSKYRHKNNFVADSGKAGLGNNKTGLSAKDLILEVPLGTLIKDLEKNTITDIIDKDDIFKIARGGAGGKGNYKRDYATKGEEGENRDVIFDYRIPNDVAILGFPNSGKTSLFNALADKDYKVADYPFTTASCVWAPVEYNFKKFTIMDTPALTEKSYSGKGAGIRFLKHLYRTKIILFTVEAGRDFKTEVGVLKDQIARFDKDILKDKKFFYLLSKADRINVKGKTDIIPISVKTKLNIENIKKSIIESLYEKDCN